MIITTMLGDVTLSDFASTEAGEVMGFYVACMARMACMVRMARMARKSNDRCGDAR